jgi:hypothetical protein
MSNYSKTTDFAAKDALTTGNANKIVKGTEIDDEFDALQTAVNSKADVNNTTFTGSTTIPSVNCNGGAIDGTVIGADTAAAVTGTIVTGSTSVRTPLIEYTDGDDAIVIADGGGVTVANLTATTADVNGGTIDNVVIGGATKAAGTFTDVVADDLTVDGTTLTVDATNNRVGIGTASPTEAISVTGNATVSGSVTAASFVGDGSAITGIAVQSKELDAIGTYAFCEYVGANGSLAAGSTTSGSNLRYAGVAEDPNVSGDSAIVVQSSGTPTGTWRIMGYLNKTSDYKVTSMFLRIS